MKHELEDQLKAFEKKGIDRRHFFKLMAMAGLLTAASHVVVLSLYAPADYPFFAIKI